MAYTEEFLFVLGVLIASKACKKSIDAGRRLVGCSWRTARKAVRFHKDHPDFNCKHKPKEKQGPKKVHHGARVQRRIDRVKEIVQETTTDTRGRTSKAFGVAAKIRDELMRRYKEYRDNPPSRETIMSDVHDLGGKSVRRKPVPTRDRKDYPARREFKQKVRTLGLTGKNLYASDESYITNGPHEEGYEILLPGEKRHGRECKERRNYLHLMVWAVIGWNYKSELIVFPAPEYIPVRYEGGETDPVTGKQTKKGTKVEGTGKKKYFSLNGERYIDVCLRPILADRQCPLNNRNGEHWFLYDNAKIHGCRVAKKYLSHEAKWRFINTPKYSPMVNPIEYAWRDLNEQMGMEVANTKRQPETYEELTEAAKRAWMRIPQKRINKYMSNWSKQVKEMQSEE